MDAKKQNWTGLFRNIKRTRNNNVSFIKLNWNNFNCNFQNIVSWNTRDENEIKKFNTRIKRLGMNLIMEYDNLNTIKFFDLTTY